ncbi:hypothetical protein QYG20_18430, partial [Xanthomonas euvesicatoria]|uniref:hypothetical protein n=1 Tax=Xanthomonas euvesicatoria TaxID=456327 RepID=UPI0032B34B00
LKIQILFYYCGLFTHMTPSLGWFHGWGGPALPGRHVLDCAAFKAIISTLPGAVPRHCGTVGGINVAIDSRDG